MKFKKSLSAMLAIAMLAAVGCGSSETPSGDGTPAVDTTPAGDSTPADGTPAVQEVVDLGGIHIDVAQWGEETRFIENPIDDYEEAVNAHRQKAMDDYNFTYDWKVVGTWANMPTFTANQIASSTATTTMSDLEAQVIRMGVTHVYTAYNQNLLWNLNELDAFDLSLDDFHKATSAKHTYGGGTWAYCIDATDVGDQYMYWNKRLFEEAGIDPNLPYELQASGDWTWDALFEICETLTKDTDGDGVIDQWAHVAQGNVICKNFMISNNASCITVDADGKFVNNTLSSEVYDALLAAEKFIINYSYNIAWDASAPEFFQTGQAAMHTGQQWLIKQWSNNMEDEVGVVMFPKGPNNTGDGYYSMVNSNNFTLPIALSKDEAEAVLTAHYQFMRTPDEFVGTGYSQYTPYYMDRESEQTIAYANDPNFKVMEYEDLFSDINMSDFNNLRWNNNTVQGMIDEKQAIIDSTLAAANG